MPPYNHLRKPWYIYNLQPLALSRKHLVQLPNFIGEQTLRGTYGGEGIQVTSNTVLSYDYLSISIPRNEPVVIQQRTPIPNEEMQIGLRVVQSKSNTGSRYSTRILSNRMWGEIGTSILLLLA